MEYHVVARNDIIRTKRGSVVILLTGLTPLTSCACPQPEPVYKELGWAEVILCFVRFCRYWWNCWPTIFSQYTVVITPPYTNIEALDLCAFWAQCGAVCFVANIPKLILDWLIVCCLISRGKYFAHIQNENKYNYI